MLSVWETWGKLGSNPCATGSKEKIEKCNPNPSVSLIVLLSWKIFILFYLDCVSVSYFASFWWTKVLKKLTNTEILSYVSHTRCCPWSAHRWHLSVLVPSFCALSLDSTLYWVLSTLNREFSPVAGNLSMLGICICG